MRSPMTPNIGASSVPTYCSEAKMVSISTERVSTSTYQPRISISISSAHEVARSAGHWKRKLRTLNGASIETRVAALIASIQHHQPVDRGRALRSGQHRVQAESGNPRTGGGAEAR